MTKITSSVFGIAATIAVASQSFALPISPGIIPPGGESIAQTVTAYRTYIFCTADTAGQLMDQGWSRQDAIRYAKWDCKYIAYGWTYPTL